MKKVLLIVIGVIAAVIAGILIFVHTTWDKKFEAPLPELTASDDPEVIARGRYLVYGPSHCATCHVPMDKIKEVENGLEIPLSGGWELNIPPGTFRAPNITPDKETGIGNMTDGEIARAMRYGVAHDNRMVMPFMPYQEMSDEDLVAIISFLRSQEPVKHEVKRSEFSLLGKALMAFGIFKPEGPQTKPPVSTIRDTSVEYGAYLAHTVADCYGCHTERDLKTGEFIGMPFAGGMHFEPDELSMGYAFVSPNLTPHQETSIIADWSEDAFVNRFKMPRLYEGSPMPWGAFSRMEEMELRAIYRYLRSIEPVENQITRVAVAPIETSK